MSSDPCINISMSHETKAELDAIYAAAGMTQRAVLARLLKWFRQQPPLLRAVILGQLTGEDAEDVVTILYRRQERQAAHGSEEADRIVDDLLRHASDAPAVRSGSLRRKKGASA
jgi:hypothetical protein